MSARQLGDGAPDGQTFGQSTTDKISFYNVTPIVQRTSAKLSATLSLFGDSGAAFVAGTSSTISGLWAFNSTMATQLIDSLVEIRALLVALGAHKGGA